MKRSFQIYEHPLTTLRSTQPHRYLTLYLKTSPLLIALLLLNCKFTPGRLLFVWNFLSWYLTLCYLVFPLTYVLFTSFRGHLSKHRNPTAPPKGFAPKAMIYAAGLPLVPLRDYDGPENWLPLKLLGRFLTFLLAPVIFPILLLLLQARAVSN